MPVSNELGNCKKALDAMMEIYRNESKMDITGNLTGSTSTADIYNTIFEKCSRRVQRDLNIDVLRNRVSRFKSKLLSAFAKEVKYNVIACLSLLIMLKIIISLMN